MCIEDCHTENPDYFNNDKLTYNECSLAENCVAQAGGDLLVGDLAGTTTPAQCVTQENCKLGSGYVYLEERACVTDCYMHVKQDGTQLKSPTNANDECAPCNPDYFMDYDDTGNGGTLHRGCFADCHAEHEFHYKDANVADYVCSLAPDCSGATLADPVTFSCVVTCDASAGTEMYGWENPNGGNAFWECITKADCISNTGIYATAGQHYTIDTGALCVVICPYGTLIYDSTHQCVTATECTGAFNELVDELGTVG